MKMNINPWRKRPDYLEEALRTVIKDRSKSSPIQQDLSPAFSSWTNLSSIPVGLFDTNSKVTNFSEVFSSCSTLYDPAKYKREQREAKLLTILDDEDIKQCYGTMDTGSC